jgi:hypothetical protein
MFPTHGPGGACLLSGIPIPPWHGWCRPVAGNLDVRERVVTLSSRFETVAVEVGLLNLGPRRFAPDGAYPFFALELDQLLPPSKEVFDSHLCCPH